MFGINMRLKMMLLPKGVALAQECEILHKWFKRKGRPTSKLMLCNMILATLTKEMLDEWVAKCKKRNITLKGLQGSACFHRIFSRGVKKFLEHR